MSDLKHVPWKTQLCESLAGALCSLGYQTDTFSVLKLLAVPPKFELGQAALPCFQFAKQLKVSPQKAAEDIRNFLTAQFSSRAHGSLRAPPISKIDLVGGYLNFHIDFLKLAEQFLPNVTNEFLRQTAQKLEPQPTGIVVEFSQPNTHKSLHVGHLRCLVLGDVVSRMLAHVGNNVVRATYPGDLGTHIAKTLWYLNEFILSKGIPLPSNPLEQADWLGEQYAKADDAFKAAVLNHSNIKRTACGKGRKF
jgi:arginyl-tRNA synthetase